MNPEKASGKTKEEKRSRFSCNEETQRGISGDGAVGISSTTKVRTP